MNMFLADSQCQKYTKYTKIQNTENITKNLKKYEKYNKKYAKIQTLYKISIVFIMGKIVWKSFLLL